VEDAIETSPPKTVEWFLHADVPFAAQGDGFVLDAAPVRLRVRVEAPAGSKRTTGPTNLMAPGKPGSITDGKQEQRGYEIRVDVPASPAVAIKAVLSVETK
jgi:hypothetical protein